MLGFYLLLVVVGIIALFVWLHNVDNFNSLSSKAVYTFIVIAVTGACVYGMFWYKDNTQMGVNMQKDWTSNVKGLERKVYVLGTDGEVIFEASGRFDLERTDTSIKFTDVNTKKRFIIYAGENHTLVIEEVDE